ncbi:hypothetical protein FCM35_KLT21481 [Carex littledalei]|uniref:Uncharacterized protein n=1 Tax=Carex littledalei TaxID=544730 RepID=A0A833R640_9POAL|nr:hypothetical protein FCM35_KLT21481 [Carex littledalei]
MGREILRQVLLRRGHLLRALSSTPPSTSVFVRRFQTDGGKDSPTDSTENVEKRLFSDMYGGGSSDPFFRKLDRVESFCLRTDYVCNVVQSLDCLVTDQAGGTKPLMFQIDSRMTNDLDLTKPAARLPPQRHEFETTTKEVLLNADFRNVRFLANFITEAGIIIKRSQHDCLERNDSASMITIFIR